MKIMLNNLKSGMKLKKTVYYGNSILIEEGIVLDEKMIEKLNKFNILSVEIEEEAVEKTSLEEILEKKSELKKVFIDDYNNCINHTEDIIKSIGKGKIDKEKMDTVIEGTIDNISLNSDIILSLLDSKSEKEFLYQHTINSVIISLVIGKALEYNETQMKMLGKGAFLHDIGMLKVDSKILDKKGELTEEEKNSIKKHVEYGLEMAGKVEKEVAEIIKYHHERMDGSGYPEGKKGDEIPELARVVAIADIYTALTEDRHYREKYDCCDAMKIVMQSSVKLIDVNILKKFLKYMPLYPINSFVILNGNRIGKVVKANENPFRPVVDIEESGKVVRIDLQDDENKKDFITGVKK